MEKDAFNLIREAYDHDVFSVFGDDPYTMPLIIITEAWMEEIPAQDRSQTHLWKYVRNGFEKCGHDEYKIIDYTYRTIMRRLAKRGVAEPIPISKGRRQKYDYELTEYGEKVCKELKSQLHTQIRLEKWRRRAKESAK